MAAAGSGAAGASVGVKPSDAELRARLTPLAYEVTQHKGTERAFTSPLTDLKTAGRFDCVVCGAPLFVSDDKFHSGCGWPSFAAPIEAAAVAEHSDRAHGMVRTEVVCSKCGAHLGHVFDDGGDRSRTGLRYCINGVSLDFKKKGTETMPIDGGGGDAATGGR